MTFGTTVVQDTDASHPECGATGFAAPRKHRGMVFTTSKKETIWNLVRFNLETASIDAQRTRHGDEEARGKIHVEVGVERVRGEAMQTERNLARVRGGGGEADYEPSNQVPNWAPSNCVLEQREMLSSMIAGRGGPPSIRASPKARTEAASLPSRQCQTDASTTLKRHLGERTGADEGGGNGVWARRVTAE
ncbi:hypothetical protein BC826DRAFT_1181826 [Russula brevipes]|nr:hypothetical protein BC826DRAFT_1181826 [Russula brevipes]